MKNRIAIISEALLIRKGLKTLFVQHLGNGLSIEEYTTLSAFKESHALGAFTFLIMDDCLLKSFSADESLMPQIMDTYLIAITKEKSLPDHNSPLVNDAIHLGITETELIDKLERWKQHWKENDSNVSNERSLSEREENVLKLVAMGMTNKEIAEKLFLSPHTIITHRKNFTRKLGIQTVSGLTVYALLNNLIEPAEVNK